MKKLFLRIAILTCICVSATTEGIEYRVEKGETLYSIAAEYGTTPAVLMSINDITDPTKVPEGMILLVPVVATYTAVDGDTLWGIAKAHGISLNGLLDLNGFPDDYDKLKAGDELIVPGNGNQIDVSDSERESSPPTIETGETGSGDENADQDSSQDAVSIVASDAAETESVGSAPFWPHNGHKRAYNGKFDGLEFIGNQGDFVYAVATGVVTWNDTWRPFGRVVIVETDDGYQFVYGGTVSVLVQKNERIAAGAKIGTFREDPETGEARLFFSVIKDGKIVDPENICRN